MHWPKNHPATALVTGLLSLSSVLANPTTGGLEGEQSSRTFLGGLSRSMPQESSSQLYHLTDTPTQSRQSELQSLDSHSEGYGSLVPETGGLFSHRSSLSEARPIGGPFDRVVNVVDSAWDRYHGHDHTSDARNGPHHAFDSGQRRESTEHNTVSMQDAREEQTPGPSQRNIENGGIGNGENSDRHRETDSRSRTRHSGLNLRLSPGYFKENDLQSRFPRHKQISKTEPSPRTPLVTEQQLVHGRGGGDLSDESMMLVSRQHSPRFGHEHNQEKFPSTPVQEKQHPKWREPAGENLLLGKPTNRRLLADFEKEDEHASNEEMLPAASSKTHHQQLLPQGEEGVRGRLNFAASDAESRRVFVKPTSQFKSFFPQAIPQEPKSETRSHSITRLYPKKPKKPKKDSETSPSSPVGVPRKLSFFRTPSTASRIGSSDASMGTSSTSFFGRLQKMYSRPDSVNKNAEESSGSPPSAATMADRNPLQAEADEIRKKNAEFRQERHLESR